MMHLESTFFLVFVFVLPSRSPCHAIDRKESLVSRSCFDNGRNRWDIPLVGMSVVIMRPAEDPLCSAPKSDDVQPGAMCLCPMIRSLSHTVKHIVTVARLCRPCDAQHSNVRRKGILPNLPCFPRTLCSGPVVVCACAPFFWRGAVLPGSLTYRRLS
ncbi:hypothetical protein BCR44DRAFT_1251676 [Catenaria anguillulae PL171]|uniref:Secreted protein n=1 Tax=Catenaria anguillulae PL171 TaxID=765915 RepID=A0A1Y2HYI6_9FUNG|nr:hypothetical protein BCR44DRAFT_1251676 [Catenaria anguillulae PL171]